MHKFINFLFFFFFKQIKIDLVDPLSFLKISNLNKEKVLLEQELWMINLSDYKKSKLDSSGRFSTAV